MRAGNFSTKKGSGEEEKREAAMSSPAKENSLLIPAGTGKREAAKECKESW